ncbi:pilus assembly protein [Prodigiosinella confusarubida]|uniref:Pilus assembly protein n=1 Tax=Serratia sp. (strain ATCC 39006) TaxID=104623 RepID=A0A2I5TNS7_SERS3|nr:ATPase, T2SS/T4P/T4SS family [Serratia sp. ATCC 39006]AUH01899.1 pilus assembly protein [Serratia sp. ATCC 39006]AUH06221.1 pilus assembly protein [Serratia sp. ATCC 39006]
MQPDKEIMDFVLAEDVPDGKGGVRLVIDTNRRTDPLVQRWVMDMVSAFPMAVKEFVSLSELNTRRERQANAEDSVMPRGVQAQDISATQQKVLTYMALAGQLDSSDIHLTLSKNEKITVIEMRIHGELEIIDELTFDEGLSLVSTIYRSMCDLQSTDFLEQIAQKGRVASNYARRAGLFGARYQHMPTPDGLYVVLRIIPDDSHKVPTMAQLGFLPEQQALAEKILRIPEGMVTLTGPTGSGKSTTLRTFSRHWLDRTQGKKRLLTIEFPVEGRIAGAIQTSVTPKSSAREAVVEAWEDSNAAALRSDPDAIVIGEMQERNSVMAAVHAVESGHIVLDTLHAPSAAGAIPRMASMGVNIQLIADPQIMIGLLSQRLVQTLCPHCRIPWTQKASALPADVRSRLEKYCNVPGICAAEQLWFRHPQGCEHCQKKVELTGRIVSRGVTGRTVLAEVIRPDARFMTLFLSQGAAVARQYWLQHLGGISRRTHLLRRLAEGTVDPLDGDLVCPLDEDELLACEVPHV